MSIEKIDNEKLQGWAAFINNLTPKKIFLTVCLAVGLVFAYSLYENKTDLAQLVSSNPPIVYSIFGVVSLFVIGGFINSLHKRIDNKQQEVMSEMRHRLDDQERNHSTNITRLEKQLANLEQRERDCNERHFALVVELSKQGFYKDAAK